AGARGPARRVLERATSGGRRRRRCAGRPARHRRPCPGPAPERRRHSAVVQRGRADGSRAVVRHRRRRSRWCVPGVGGDEPGALVMAEGLAGGVVLAWTERDGAGVRAQHVDAAAGTAWADGAPATDGALAAADVQIAVDALGRTAVAWQDARDASDGCPQDCVTRVQRLGADGAREWSDGGRPLGTLPAFGARIVAVGDGVVAAWQHCPTPTCAGASDVHVQALGGSASLTVGEAPLDSRVALVADGAGGVIVAWWQCAAGACEVRTRRLALDALQALAPAAPAADLVLTALTAAAQAAPGQTLQVSSIERNAGGTAAASFRVGFYLSSSNSSAIGGSLIGFRTI